MTSEPGGHPKPSYEALVELDEITRRLRKECPWDREQNERTIVPHTVEEAYELADAANRGDDSKLVDELGDLLFAVVNVARKLHVDPELALRSSADRFRARVDTGVELAASEGRSWNDLPPDEQLIYYARARLSEGGPRQQ